MSVVEHLQLALQLLQEDQHLGEKWSNADKESVLALLNDIEEVVRYEV